MKIFSSDKCGYCNKLKGMLDSAGIEYTSIDIETPKGEAEFTKISKLTKNSDIPTVIVNKQIISPGIGFRTIEQCYETILRFI